MPTYFKDSMTASEIPQLISDVLISCLLIACSYLNYVIVSSNQDNNMQWKETYIVWILKGHMVAF